MLKVQFRFDGGLLFIGFLTDISVEVVCVREKEFSSFDTASVIRELQPIITGSWVSNVYQVDNKTLLIKLHKPDMSSMLVVEAGKRLHLTTYEPEKPRTPPAFCMALRKHLRNVTLISIEQFEFERVITLSFTSKIGSIKLIIELFGDGNFILVDHENKIVQALWYKRMRDRNIVRGETLQFAPSTGKNPFKISNAELQRRLKGLGDVELVRGLVRLLSIGGIYAEEILLRASINKNKLCSALTEAESNAIFENLQILLSQIGGGKLEPRIVLNKIGAPIDVLPFSLRRYDSSEYTFQVLSSFNEALDEFYVRVAASETASSDEFDGLKREAESLKRMIADQERVLTETGALASREKRFGDLIYEHFGELQTLVDEFLTGKQLGKELKVIIEEVLIEKKDCLVSSRLFESFDPRNSVVNVNVDGFAFGLDLRRTLYENAAGYYDLGKRAKQKQAGAKKALDETLGKLAELETRIRGAEESLLTKPAKAAKELAERKIKHKEWYEKFRWFMSSDGFLVVAGKDAVSNEVLIRKYTEDNDIVFHAEIVGAPFVVIKTNGKEPSEECLKEAAEFAAAYSRGWREGFGTVDVYYVRPEQLSKGGPSGESVSHGAFVVLGERRWMRNTPLRLAVGIITKQDSEIAFVGGPTGAVRAKTNTFLVIAPGDLEGKELFKRILRALVGKLPIESREKALRASIEEIREYVPFSKGTILEST